MVNLSLKGIHYNSLRSARSDYLGLMPKTTTLPQIPAQQVFEGGKVEEKLFTPGCRNTTTRGYYSYSLSENMSISQKLTYIMYMCIFVL